MAVAQVVDVPGEPPEPDVSSLLAGMNAKTPGKKGKSKVPVVTGFEPLADEVAAKKQQFKQAETELAVAESQLLEHARAKYEQRAKAGDYSASLTFTGAKTPGVRVSFSDRFNKIPVESKERLVEAAGERYSQLFDESRVLTLRKTDDASILHLLKTLGQETFQEFFEVKLEIKPKSGFAQRQFELPDDVRGVVTQYKPSVTAL